MAERLIAADSKSAEGANPPWVRIPPFPPNRTKAALSKAAFFESSSQVLGMYSERAQLQGAFSFQTTLDSDFKCNTKIPEEACQGKSVSHQQWFSAMKQDSELKLDLQNNYKGNVYEKNT